MAFGAATDPTTPVILMFLLVFVFGLAALFKKS